MHFDYLEDEFMDPGKPICEVFNLRINDEFALSSNQMLRMSADVNYEKLANEETMKNPSKYVFFDLIFGEPIQSDVYQKLDESPSLQN